MSHAIYKFGTAIGVTAADTKILTNFAVANPFPTTAGQLTLSSTSDDDKPGGIGVSAVRIIGVIEEGSGEWSETIINVTLNGITDVTVVAPWAGCLRVYTMRSIAVGSAGVASGPITAKIDGVSVAEILPQFGSAKAGVWTNDSAHDMYLRRVWAAVGKIQGVNPEITIDFFVQVIGEPRQSGAPLEFTGPGKDEWVVSGNGVSVPPQTDIWCEVTSFNGTNALVHAGFDVFEKFDHAKK